MLGVVVVMMVGMSMSPPPTPRPRRRQPRPAPQPTYNPGAGSVAPTTPALTPGDRLMGATFHPTTGFRAGSKPMSESGRQAQMGLNFFNPLASVTDRVLGGESPRFSDFAMDAGLLAAGFIPFVGPGLRAGGQQAARAGRQQAQPALETSEAIWARRDALDRLINEGGPRAVHQFLGNPKTAYLSTQNPDLLRRYFAETSERIPRGTQMHRAPSAGQVTPRLGSQSVPLPRQVGAEFLPNRIQSTGGPGDLQELGGLVRGTTASTGGGQTYAPGMVTIEAMEDLRGIFDINEFLARYAGQYGGRTKIGSLKSDFGTESVLGPQTRYVVNDFNPAGVTIQGQSMPSWYLQAFNK